MHAHSIPLRFAIALGFLFGSGMVWALPATQLDPGRWRITTHQEIAGASFSFMPRHRELCLSPRHPFPGVGEADCRKILLGHHGPTFTWRLHCTPPGAMPATGQARIRYSGQRLSGGVRLVIAGNRDLLHTSRPIRLHLNEQMSGRRIGPCDQASDKADLG